MLLLLLASLRTWTYARLWNDRVALYSAAVAARPGSVQAHILLCTEFRDRGEFDRAEEVAAAARALAPDHWEVYFYSGTNALQRGDLDAAEAFAVKALAQEQKQAVSALALLQEIRERRAATQPATAPSQ